MATIIILVLISIFYGLCIGGIIVEFKYTTGDFPSVDDDDLLLVLITLLFAPICCVAGGAVCLYKVISESMEKEKEKVKK